jgi:uncharacterized protein (TIGR03545 family)
LASTPLLKSTAISAAQSVTGARADVAELTTRFFPPQLDVTGVALADASKPGVNLVEFESLHISLAGNALLRRQFVVEEGRLAGVKFGTSRTDDGQLPPQEDEEDAEPSWLTEQLESIGTEWLEQLTLQAESLLDPNHSETYRTGNEVYSKWEERFALLQQRTQSLQPRVAALRQQFAAAQQGDPLARVERYLQLAANAEQLQREALQFKTDLTGIVPEARTDFARLDQARQNDQQKIMQTASLLKPDARRMSEALIGDQMYRQLQEALSWVEAATSFRQQLKEQARPERRIGTTFPFPMRNPAPDFHLKTLAMTGELPLQGRSVPFEGVLTDVTSDAPLLGRPGVFRLKTSEDTPLKLKVVHDATTEISTTLLTATYSSGAQQIRSGDDQRGEVGMRLAGLGWETSLVLTGDAIDGTIQLASQVEQIGWVAPQTMRPEFSQAVNEALAAVHSVEAQLIVGGTLRRPSMQIKSDLGQQVAAGIQSALTTQLNAAKQRLVTEVNSVATSQARRLSARFSEQYDKLLADNAQVIAGVQDVQRIVASVRSGRVDAETLFRTATESRLIDDEHRQKLDGAVEDVNQKLRKAGLPEGLPGILPFRRR